MCGRLPSKTGTIARGAAHKEISRRYPNIREAVHRIDLGTRPALRCRLETDQQRCRENKQGSNEHVHSSHLVSTLLIRSQSGAQRVAEWRTSTPDFTSPDPA